MTIGLILLTLVAPSMEDILTKAREELRLHPVRPDR